MLVFDCCFLVFVVCCCSFVVCLLNVGVRAALPLCPVDCQKRNRIHMRQLLLAQAASLVDDK